MQVIKLAKHMIFFGFYNFKELLHLTELLLDILEPFTPAVPLKLPPTRVAGMHRATSMHLRDGMISKSSEHANLTEEERMGLLDTVQIDMKLMIIDMLQFIVDVRLDYRISSLLVNFKKQFNATQSEREIILHKGGTPPPNSCIFEHSAVLNAVEKVFAGYDSSTPESDILELDKEKGGRFVRILLYLGMLNYPSSVVSGALSLFFRQFRQREELMDSVKQVQLLVTRQDQENYHIIRKKIDRLRNLVEKSELWVSKQRETKRSRLGLSSLSRLLANQENSKSMDHDGDIDDREWQASMAEKNYDTVKEVLVTFTTLMQGHGRGEHEQRLLRNMGAHTVILDLLQINFDKTVDVRMMEIMELAHSFLQAFCRGCRNNQSLLYEQIHLFMSEGGDMQLLEVETMRSIFQNNPDLCMKISGDLVSHIFHCLEKERHVRYLQFLQAVVKVEGQNMRKLQDLVMQELASSGDDVLVFYNDPKAYTHLCELMQSPTERLHENTELSFHVHLVRLLALCTEGKNIFTEINCHSLLPLDDIVKISKHDDCPAEIKLEYMHFLIHCYIDTEVEMKEIFSREYIWTVFNIFTEDVEKLLSSGPNVPKRNLNPKMTEYLAVVMMLVIRQYFSSTFLDPAVIWAHQSYLVRLLESCFLLHGSYIITKHQQHCISETISSLFYVARVHNIALPFEIMSRRRKFNQTSPPTNFRMPRISSPGLRCNQPWGRRLGGKSFLSVPKTQEENTNESASDNQSSSCESSDSTKSVERHFVTVWKRGTKSLAGRVSVSEDEEVIAKKSSILDVYECLLDHYSRKFSADVQEERLVLVDLLHEPELLFAPQSRGWELARNGGYLKRLVTYTKEFASGSDEKLCINILQTLQQILSVGPSGERKRTGLCQRLLCHYIYGADGLCIAEDTKKTTVMSRFTSLSLSLNSLRGLHTKQSMRPRTSLQQLRRSSQNTMPRPDLLVLGSPSVVMPGGASLRSCQSVNSTPGGATNAGTTSSTPAGGCDDDGSPGNGGGSGGSAMVSPPSARQHRQSILTLRQPHNTYLMKDEEKEVPDHHNIVINPAEKSITFTSVRRHSMQCLMDESGVTDLVIDLVMSNTSDDLFHQSVLLGIKLLDGGNSTVQMSFFHNFCQTANDSFFSVIHSRMDEALKEIRSSISVSVAQKGSAYGGSDDGHIPPTNPASVAHTGSPAVNMGGTTPTGGAGAGGGLMAQVSPTVSRRSSLTTSDRSQITRVAETHLASSRLPRNG
eukprot:scpid27301/ scgid2512/ Inositol 1,4,5-trisphosphate receptor type 1; IP3 receptor isoform 1; Type 1 inositol 1,4,5-trisphosphate receptor